MVTYMECSSKYASNSTLDVTIVSKLGGLDIMFGMQTDALIANSRYFGIGRYCGYLGHLESDRKKKRIWNPIKQLILTVCIMSKTLKN